MAEFNTSHNEFDNSILDVNENLSDSGSNLYSNSLQTHESVPPIENLIENVSICQQLEFVSDNCLEITDEISSLTKKDDLSPMANEIRNNEECYSDIQDSNNFVECTTLVNLNEENLNFSSGFGSMTSDFNNEENCGDLKDEEFHDAVQFFKDPSSLNFLENAGSSSAPKEPLITRSSLYMSFDPLHAKFFSQPNKSNALQNIVETDVEPDILSENKNNIDPVNHDFFPHSNNIVSQNDVETHVKFDIPSDSTIKNNFEPSHTEILSLANDMNVLKNVGMDAESSNPHENEFDTSHPEFVSQPNKANGVENAVEIDAESRMPYEKQTENIQDKDVSNVINNQLAYVSPRTSIGNVLMSFDSPVITTNVKESMVNKESNQPQKLYTEEDLQQALKIQELIAQETFLKKQHDLEVELSQKQNEAQKQKDLCSALHSILKEIYEAVIINSNNEFKLREKIEELESENIKLKTDLKTFSDKDLMIDEKLEEVQKENSKLKENLKTALEDLKASTEDIQNIESSFADLHKRYEQCKSKLAVYSQNESNLKLQVEEKNAQLNEKEEMYEALKTRTQEMLDKANAEISNTKKVSDAQVAVLNAQLKKAELRISSLESDIKQVKIENDKLSSICDELMAKVSGT